MYSKKSLIKMVKNMGIQSTDTLFIHSSMKSIGLVEGGAETVLDVLMECLRDGLLVLPTHTWAYMSEEHNTYDPKKEPSCVGILTNLFMKREGVIRSLHPTHSVAAVGEDSINYVAGEENQLTPCGVGSCYDKLRDRNAKILLIGVDHTRNTFIHCVEEILEVPERLTEEPVKFNIVKADGQVIKRRVYRHYNRTTNHISESYGKLSEAFEVMGATKSYRFGDAQCILCDVNRMFDVTNKILSHRINCLMEVEDIPKEWWIE